VAAVRGGATGFAAHVQAPQTESPAAVPAPRLLAALGTVLAAQAAEDGAAERRRALTRGRSLLDELDLIRIGLLDGALPAAAIRRLNRLLRADWASLADAKLNAVLVEIELRAAVELVKRQQDAPERDEHGPAGTSDS
jgi:hypothetical protein